MALVEVALAFSCVVALLCASSSTAEDVTRVCKKKSVKVRMDDLGDVVNDRYVFISHATFDESSHYWDRKKCTFKIQRAAESCDELRISCDFFDVGGYPDGGGCDDDDVVTVAGERYCGSSGPDVLSTSEFTKFTFKTRRDGRTGAGFRCSAQCMSASTPGGACACGRIKRSVRIVGGVQADVNEYPWQAALVYNSTGPDDDDDLRPDCGGTLISAEWVLTAAHCVAALHPTRIVLGDHDYTVEEPHQIVVNVSEVLPHANFDDVSLDFDYALVRLSHPVNFSAHFSAVEPACMPTGPPKNGDRGVITGWGATSADGPQSHVLMEADVDLFDRSTCQAFDIFDPGDITRNMFCAGVAAGGVDTCKGDSGGPLVVKDNNGSNFHLSGVTSWGYGECGDADSPGVYADVWENLEWILDKSDNLSGGTCPPT